MTAPVAPMEARCAVCGDTGSKSQDIDGHQDCTACDAVERRAHVMGYLREISPYMTVGSKAWAAYLFAQRQAAPVAQPAQQESIKIMPQQEKYGVTNHGDNAVFVNFGPAQQVEAVKYGCHIDLPDGHHDNCVLDGGNRDDCTYARRYGEEGRKKCGEWKPIKVVKAQQAGDVALLKAVGALIKSRGRFHAEQNYAALVVAYDAAMAKEKA